MHVAYITFSSESEAKKLAKLLLDSSLIASANIYPIVSMYKWEGEVKDEKEFVLWAKTELSKVSDIEKLVLKEHSYKIPCVVNFSVEGTASYEKWVMKQLV